MNRLKYLRTARGENLEKVAEYLNVSIQTISNYENEKRLLVSFETLKTIGTIIHCMINEEEKNMYNEDK